MAAVVAALVVSSGGAGAALAGSLPREAHPRPGPDILYAPAADAPQLDNAPGGPWRAAPILVSGGSAYRDGEFLYQDFLYDDHGAREQSDPFDARGSNDFASTPNGTYTYPTSAAYANNAADLVEFRVEPLTDSTALRVTLNTLKDRSLVAVSVAIGGTPGVSLPFPDGANVTAPADLFLTVHPSGSGMVGDLVRAGSDTRVGSPLPVTVDMLRRQIEVQIPHGDWDPAGQVVRLAAGVGLWDRANGRYQLPQASADATHPGGSGGVANPPAFFNVAFRSGEPLPSPVSTSPASWRDRDQGGALAGGDVSEFHADVDFGKLAAGTDDESGVPRTGPIDRILPSHFETAQGANFAVNCQQSGAPFGGANCPGQFQGQLQPYAIYVPQRPQPADGYGMTLLLHAYASNYNEFTGTRYQSQFGERGPGSIVITPESRGPDGYYDGYAGADAFEVWADVARRYKLNPDWSAITGYSMGGIGTFKLAEQFPDLFAKAQPTVGYSQDNNAVASLRNVPLLMWNSVVDELAPPVLYLPTAEQLDSLGYRYELDAFAPSEHFTLAINDQFAPAAEFLGATTVNRDPPHITYVAVPPLDYATLGFTADHAYWLSGLKLRDTTKPSPFSNAEGTIDVSSHGFGIGDATPSATGHGAGTLTGGALPAAAYTRQYKTWGPTPGITKADTLDISATNIRYVTIDPRRARIDCAARLNVKSDGPITVTLVGCPPPSTSVQAEQAPAALR